MPIATTGDLSLRGTFQKGEGCDRGNTGQGCAVGLRCAYSMDDPEDNQICVPELVCGQKTEISG